MASMMADVLRYLRHVVADEQAGEQSDGHLLRQFINERSAAAFTALLLRHGPLVLSVCRQVLRNPHDAEDAFQAAFLVLARKAGSIAKRDSLAGWLHRVALNTARTAKSGIAKRRDHERKAV